MNKRQYNAGGSPIERDHQSGLLAHSLWQLGRGRLVLLVHDSGSQNYLKEQSLSSAVPWRPTSSPGLSLCRHVVLSLLTFTTQSKGIGSRAGSPRAPSPPPPSVCATISSQHYSAGSVGEERAPNARGNKASTNGLDIFSSTFLNLLARF